MIELLSQTKRTALHTEKARNYRYSFFTFSLQIYSITMGYGASVEQQLVADANTKGETAEMPGGTLMIGLSAELKHQTRFHRV